MIEELQSKDRFALEQLEQQLSKAQKDLGANSTESRLVICLQSKARELLVKKIEQLKIDSLNQIVVVDKTLGNSLVVALHRHFISVLQRKVEASTFEQEAMAILHQ